MQKKKENFINKIVKKNYESELEVILEQKTYDEDAKSLLLSTLYKIESGYKDYKTVKRDTVSKEDYIKEFVSIINQECDDIKLKEISDKKQLKKLNDKIKVDFEKKKIECYPIEKELLYAISMINRKENIVKNRLELINNSMTNLINIGRSIEFVEPLRDFNGWSWSTEKNEIDNIQCNLAYQLMRMLVGNNFLLEWIKNREKIIDYLEFFEDELESKYGAEIAECILENIIKISILVDIKKDKKQKEKWIELRQNLTEEFNKINDKKTYIQNLTEEKKRLNNQIKITDQIINDKLKLKEEYKKRNENLELNKKIFSIRVLEKIMKEERLQLSTQIKECNKKLKPRNYFLQKNDLENKVKLLEVLDFENWESKAEECVNLLNLNYLKSFKIKIIKAKTRDELINLLYEFRYFCVLPYNTKIENFSVKNTKEYLQEIARLLVQKCIANNVIVNIGTNKEIILQICEIVFNTRVIKLEDIYIEVEEKEKKYYIQVFDENVIEKNNEMKKNTNIKFNDGRLNRKIKLII